MFLLVQHSIERGENMFFSDNEKQVMGKFFSAIDRESSQIYVLTFFNGDVVEAKVDTCYETDNGLDDNDPGFEEYHACAMRITKIFVDKSKTLEEGKLIEINYHNYPQQIKDVQGNII